jgi:hypothetical protein
MGMLQYRGYYVQNCFKQNERFCAGSSNTCNVREYRDDIIPQTVQCSLKRIANTRLIRGKVAKWGHSSKKFNFKMADENLILPFWH